jgi:uncharacterized protein (TIGR02145 family)
MSEFTRHGRMLLLAAAVVLAAVGTFYLSDAAEPSGTFTDTRDGKRYKTAAVGGKTCMAENLNYQPKTGNSWCYENDKSLCDKYGRLYDWKTATKACPAGWHLPSRWEWDILGRAAGGEKRPGEEYDAVDWYGAGKTLKAKSGWIDPVGKSGSGSDDYGWAALPGGYYGYYDSSFTTAEVDGYWWTATEIWDERAYSRNMYYGNGYLSENGFHKGVGLSVRCLQDERKYTVTVLSAGADAKGGGSYVPDETVTVTAGIAPGKQFRNWTTANGGVTFTDAFKSTTTFIMPANNVTVKATFDKIIVESGTLSDERDGKTYKTVVIGGKRWMAENLNYQTSNGSQCYHDSISYCDKYGKLYTWDAAKSACPAGWHLPARWEWDYLEEAVGSRDIAGMKLKSKSGWNWNKYRKTSGGGTDDYGFSALPGGYRWSDNFASVGDNGYWWTATEPSDDNRAASRAAMYFDGSRTYWYRVEKNTGASARCVQDGIIAAEETWKKEFEQQKKKREAEERKTSEQQIEKNTTYFADSRDGKKYRAIKIGGRTWMAQNLNYHTAKGSWCYNDDKSNCGKYGRLYNWETAKKVCPSGWYLPYYREWNSLVFTATKDDKCITGGGWAGMRLKSKSGWRYSYNDDRYSSTDEYGFSAQPGGYRESHKNFSYDDDESDSGEEADYGRFKEADSSGYWWAATTDDDFGDGYAKRLGLRYDSFGVSDLSNNKGDGLSVRCILGDGGGERSDSMRIVKEMREEDRKKKEKERKRMEAKKAELAAQQLAKRLIAKVSTYFTDSRDGQKYRAVTIGGKRWMAQNLNYQPKSGNSWCYNDSVSYCDKYGRLYDWETAKTACPPMWRLPTGRDWNGLDTAAGGVFERGKLRAASGWNWDDFHDVSGNGTDDFGFSILPGGQRYSDDEGFGGVGKQSQWWTIADSTDNNYPGYEAYARGYYMNNGWMSPIEKGAGHSVRCLQDTSGGKHIRREPSKAK